MSYSIDSIRRHSRLSGYEVYVVFPSSRLAGCEKRILGVAVYLSKAHPRLTLHVVAPSSLINNLQASIEFTSFNSNDNVVFHRLGGSTTSYLDFWRQCFWFFFRQPRGIVVHYPLVYPIFIKFLFNHLTIVSWVSNRPPSSQYKKAISRILTWISLLEANIIDILNPSNYHLIKKTYWFRSKSRLTTGGTHVDPKIFKPANKDFIVGFLARLEPEKQGLRYIQSLPLACKILRTMGIPLPSFYICGWGSEESLIRKSLAGEEFEGLSISLFQSENPSVILSKTMVFMSLQKSSNYPSKALAEAMMAGAFPVLTDSPDSGLMVSSELPHSIVPVDFSPRDIAMSIANAWNASKKYGQALSEVISATASKRFSVERQAAYFGDIYAELAQGGYASAKARADSKYVTGARAGLL